VKSRLWRTVFENTYAKVQKLKALITRKETTLIEVDGGVTNKNAKQLVEQEQMFLVAGSMYLKLPNRNYCRFEKVDNNIKEKSFKWKCP
jgi:pentose-5-phosphate-3-epimerase